MTFWPILGLVIKDARGGAILASRSLEGGWRSPWNEFFDPVTEGVFDDVAKGHRARVKLPGEREEREVYLVAIYR